MYSIGTYMQSIVPLNGDKITGEKNPKMTKD